MATKPSLSKAKEKAWQAFSAYIRTRDCLKTTGTLENGICITCDKLIPYKGSHAGHFIGGRGGAVLFEEDLVNLQCEKCNKKTSFGGLDGNYQMYTLKMVERHGKEWVEEKVKLRNVVRQYKLYEVEEITKKYRAKYKELINA